MYYFRKWQNNLKNVENKQMIGVSWPHHNLEYFTQIVQKCKGFLDVINY